jgi:sugar lactone lactonase YvrE
MKAKPVKATMNFILKATFPVLLAAFLTLISPAAHAGYTYNWSFSGSTLYAAGSGSLTIDTNYTLDDDAPAYVITNFTGTFNGEVITGLDLVNDDNFFFFQPYLMTSPSQMFWGVYDLAIQTATDEYYVNGFAEGGYETYDAGTIGDDGGSGEFTAIPAVVLGTTNVLERPAAGSDSVVLGVLDPGTVWTATANAAWLHLSPANQTATGSTNVIFSFDANSGATRTGTLTIQGLTVTVTQAPAGYTQAGLNTLIMGLGGPYAVAVDGAGDVFVTDTGNGAIKEMAAGTTNVTTLVTGLATPSGLVVDGAGNLYFSDFTTKAVYELPAGTPTPVTVSGLTTLLATGLVTPTQLALDSSTNLYIVDTGAATIYELAPGASTPTPLVPSGFGLSIPSGVAVDAAGNVYVVDNANPGLYELPGTILPTTYLSTPNGLAVDGGGNLYSANDGNVNYPNGTIDEFSAATQTETSLVTNGVFIPYGVTADAQGDVYVADTFNGAVEEIPKVFVNTSAVAETAAAGSDVLPAVVPATASLSGNFAPKSSADWLTITATNAGVVSFAFTANPGLARTAYITVLGQSVAVTQAQATELGTMLRVEGPAAGGDSVILAARPSLGWTATAQYPWVQLSPGSAAGYGSTNVFFTFTANTDGTRTNVLTIAGLTLTVIQAGATYAPVTAVTTLATAASGLVAPGSVAVDGTGNVYIGDLGNATVSELPVGGTTLDTLVPQGVLVFPSVAADAAGNVFISDNPLQSLYEVPAGMTHLNTMINFALDLPYSTFHPEGVAVDSADDLYVASSDGEGVFELPAGASTLVTTVNTNLNQPPAVTVDIAGNLYIADQNPTVQELLASGTGLNVLASSALNPSALIFGIAVDGGGNVYFPEFVPGNAPASAIFELPAGGTTPVAVVSAGLNSPEGVAVDPVGDVYFADAGTVQISELPHAFVVPATVVESPLAGSDSLPAVVPASENLTGALAPSSDSPWLTILGVNNGVVSFAMAANKGPNRLGHIYLLGQAIPIFQGGVTALGSTVRTEGPAGGNDGVVLSVSPTYGTWTAVVSAGWLHVNAANASGVSSTNILFSYDANAGATRTGTLTIAGLMLTVTQAGATYTLAGVVTPVVTNGLSEPEGIAVDGAGNVYIGDVGNDAVYELPAGNGPLTTLVSRAQGLNCPLSVAVNSATNLYILDSLNQEVYELPMGGNTLTALASTDGGLIPPNGVAADNGGNVYIAEVGYASVFELPAGGTSLTTLSSYNQGLVAPTSVAVDVAGNVFIGDDNNYQVYEQPDGSANVTALPGMGFTPLGVAVDGADNVFFTDSFNNQIDELPLAGAPLTTLVSPATYALNVPQGVAVDGAGDVFIADTYNAAVEELPRAFVDATARLETAAAGTDQLLMVLPSTANLGGSFTPISDSPWLTITSTSGGVVSFAFTADNGLDRTAHISLLGRNIAITQAGIPALGSTARLEGPAAGGDSVVLAVGLSYGPWTAGANNAWLHITSGSTGGSGSTNVFFTYDANPGATRVGTLTMAGMTLTVTQAGNTYVSAGRLTAVVMGQSGVYPYGLAVDRIGDVYMADILNMAIYGLASDDSSLNAVVSSGLLTPFGVAVDGTNNLFITDQGNQAIFEQANGTSILVPLVTTGLVSPTGVAVDRADNLFVTDPGNYALYELPAGGSGLTTLVGSGLDSAYGVAVDVADNVYVVNANNNKVYELSPGGTNLITLPSTGETAPTGVAVDGAGNVFMLDSVHNTVKELPAGGSTLTTVVATGLNFTDGLAVDNEDDIFISEPSNEAVYELPRTFVDPTAKWEEATAGSDSLPVVLPSTVNMNGPFTPTSDSAWLTITGTAGGVVSYTFTANPAGNRTAHIHVFGQVMPVTQYAFYASENPSGFKDGVSFTATQPAEATGSFVFLTNNVPLSTNALNGGVATSGVTALLPRGTNLVTVEYVGDGTYAGFTNTLEQVVTNHPQVAATYNLARMAGLKLHIFWANVVTNWSDADGDPVTLTGLNLVTTNGVNLLTNSAQILYTNNLNVNDQISYTITDGQGATNTGLINVVVNPFVISRQAPANLYYGVNAITATFNGIPGFSYEVQRSTNLVIGRGWVNIATNSLGANGLINVNDTFMDQGGVVPAAAYYRLEWQP